MPQMIGRYEFLEFCGGTKQLTNNRKQLTICQPVCASSSNARVCNASNPLREILLIRFDEVLAGRRGVGKKRPGFRRQPEELGTLLG